MDQEIIQRFIALKIDDPNYTIKEFCLTNNLGYDYFVHKLNADPKVMAIILNGIRKRYHHRSIQVDEALFNAAKAGDPKAIQLWYAKMEQWIPPVKEEGVEEFSFIISNSLLTSDDQSQYTKGMAITLRRGKLALNQDTPDAELPVIEDKATEITSGNH